MQPSSTAASQPFWAKQAPITFVGVILLGLICSTLYDLLVKPGLTGFGRFTLDFLTLGSKQMLDSSYASAALDPNPVTGLLLLQGALLAAFMPAFTLLGKKIGERNRENFEQSIKGLPEDQVVPKLEIERNRLVKRIKRLMISLWILLLPLIVMMLIAFSMHNQSVLVWRVFNANLAIITPVAAPKQIAEFKAMFAQMKSKEEYVLLTSQMTNFAAQHGVQLHAVETW
jgi:hypothetical protein